MLRPSSVLSSMSGKFAFAVFVAALFALPRFTVAQAQGHLQPRDILPTENNSTQDHVLPRDDLAPTFANTSAASGVKMKKKRALVARDGVVVGHPFQLLAADSYPSSSCTIGFDNATDNTTRKITRPVAIHRKHLRSTQKQKPRLERVQRCFFHSCTRQYVADLIRY